MNNKHTWRINMKNGQSFTVVTDINNLNDLIKFMFGEVVSIPIVSTWQLDKRVHGKLITDIIGVDTVAIVSTDVSSIEYWSGSYK